MLRRRSTGARRSPRWALALVAAAVALVVTGVLTATDDAPPRSVSAAGPSGSGLAAPTARAAGATSAAPAPHGAGGPTTGPVSTAPPAGSLAYRQVRAAWDAGDLARTPPAGTVWRSVEVGGQLRRYLLSVPAGAGPHSPLVVVFHGLDQRAGAFAEAYRLVPATRAAGEVLALPESSGPAFNDGRLGADGPDDDAFTLAVVDQLTAARLGDPARVVVAGFSNGAGMAMSVAARHPGRVAALVSIDGALMAAPGSPRPTAPVRAYLVHGTADPVQPWAGRRSRGPTWPAYISQPATVAQWVQAGRAGTATPPERTTQLGGHGTSRVTVRTWSPAAGGAPVTFYAVEGMAHVWPTAAKQTVDATALVVDAARRTGAAG